MALKNIEWGVMAYLSQSKYGKYGNASFPVDKKEVYINNYYSVANNAEGGVTKTECSAGRPSTGASDASNYLTICAYEYNAGLEGMRASTTGNIYEIYDTSGEALKKMMGVYENKVANSRFEATFFTNATVGYSFLGKVVIGLVA